jgi:hypothetical protein
MLLISADAYPTNSLHRGKRELNLVSLLLRPVAFPFVKTNYRDLEESPSAAAALCPDHS